MWKRRCGVTLPIKWNTETVLGTFLLWAEGKCLLLLNLETLYTDAKIYT